MTNIDPERPAAKGDVAAREDLASEGAGKKAWSEDQLVIAGLFWLFAVAGVILAVFVFLGQGLIGP